MEPPNLKRLDQEQWRQYPQLLEMLLSDWQLTLQLCQFLERHIIAVLIIPTQLRKTRAVIVLSCGMPLGRRSMHISNQDMPCSLYFFRFLENDRSNSSILAHTSPLYTSCCRWNLTGFV